MSNITQNFKGIIAITNPKNSWAAKWLKKRKINCEVIPYISDFERNERLADGTLDAIISKYIAE